MNAEKVDNVGEDDNDIPNLPSKCFMKLLNTMSKYDSSIFQQLQFYAKHTMCAFLFELSPLMLTTIIVDGSLNMNFFNNNYQ